MSEVLQAIAKRSSTRGFTDEKLTREQLEQLIAAGLQAPTAANKQEIHITVVDGGDPVLAELEALKNELRGIQNPAANFYYGAPTVLFISADADYYWSKLDAGIAVENIAIAAEGMGLGSLIIGCVKDALAGEKKAYYADALQFPAGYEYEIAIALGHKAVSKEPHEYDKDKQVTYLND